MAPFRPYQYASVAIDTAYPYFHPQSVAASSGSRRHAASVLSGRRLPSVKPEPLLCTEVPFFYHLAGGGAMGKHEFLTPKAIANRIKAKGLQKLRWYCQMCQKQFRDENGFKCHCMSGFSDEFLDRAHRHSRVAATVVYNEYIADRHHVLMNSTRWAALTEFVKFLGRKGYCKVEDTPKGWFITYIDRAPKAQEDQVAEDERQESMIASQIERAQSCLAKVSDGDDGNVAEGESESGSEEEPKANGKIAIALQKSAPGPKVNPFDDKPRKEKDGVANKKEKDVKAAETRRSALDELMKEEEEAKERSNKKTTAFARGLWSR
ncbi:hypothetical protein HU200_012429 [Digitaria exilis]|uniref:DNA/RNA-binding protein Kin17 WH-like domain-containing protein n=1 Tax=Digitaria exilis TaxID=1010633 RepID=A0A835KKG5_9POAL|nr:hypothetical protein HU200_012429 [Digitaria exilis]